MSKRLDKSQLSDSEEEIGRFVWSGCSSIDWRCWSQICWKFRQSSSGTSPISCCSETGPRAGGWGGILDNEVRIKVTFRKCWLQQWLQGEPGTEEGFWMLLRMRRKFSWESSDGFTDDQNDLKDDHDNEQYCTLTTWGMWDGLPKIGRAVNQGSEPSSEKFLQYKLNIKVRPRQPFKLIYKTYLESGDCCEDMGRPDHTKLKQIHLRFSWNRLLL